ncbi:long-chain-fatty-acid--CoA ligase [Ruixingdingia sedimenti]|uniref:Long-chain-fatty-acid--CoA ligase n=1 Tax=Ruixingdingia sedimenti TaxID=3073604 RepID=A0ABU1F441_9RHOB|nr:long-chain-fatty-acid--CoA ligase [Xinfangfangia sp. LG-4]MDR5651219.1 long-chain-fatty-acid--CoA ligase [Xinfangfangia sp. LG-4]
MAQTPDPAADRAARNALTTVGDVLRHHARWRGDRTALLFQDDVVSFAEWDRRANRIANGLAAAGCGVQARIGYLGKNDSRYFEVMMACAKAGMVLTPIGWRLALPEILFLLADFDAEFLFIGTDYLDYLPEIRRACPKIRDVVIVGAAAGDVPGFDAWRDGQPDTDPGVAVGPDDVVLQLHTSGTTGRPKGAMLTHLNVLAMARHAETGELTEFTDADLVLAPLPLFHSGGTCWALYAPYVGAAVCTTREANSAHVLEAFARFPVTKAGLVPAVIQQILNDPGFNPDLFRHLNLIGYGGSPITVELLREGIRKFGPIFVQMFGMTETTTVGSTLMPEDHDVNRPELLTSCGRAYHDMEIRIIDAEGRDLPPGETGEILLRGPSVMKGYYGRPEATAEVLRDGWYHSGDAGYLDAGGYLYIRDRIKDMIISGGENIYPAEVESALSEHPAVLESGVVGVPSERWGEEVKAFVVLRNGQQATAEELIAHCRARIAHFKCPKSVDFLPALPRNPSGKILKRELRAPYWAADRKIV